MKQSIYLETSVVGAYLDNGEPFRRDLTIRWWEHEMSEYRPVVSQLAGAFSADWSFATGAEPFEPDPGVPSRAGAATARVVTSGPDKILCRWPSAD